MMSSIRLCGISLPELVRSLAIWMSRLMGLLGWDLSEPTWSSVFKTLEHPLS
jgi:hypothetical protein